jgi:hypothetical protein
MIGQAHRVPELGTVHDPGSPPRIGIERPAQLAVQRARLVEVNPLSDQGRPPAAATTLAIGVALAGGSPDQRQLKFGSA